MEKEVLMMRKILLASFILVLAFPLVSAMVPVGYDESYNESYNESKNETIEIEPTIIEYVKPIDIAPVELDVKYLQSTASLLTSFLKLIGIKEDVRESDVKEGDTTVLILDSPVAIIPASSKFSGLKVHEICLRFQYGTDAWYSCEVGLQ